jgi:hypothetical protein
MCCKLLEAQEQTTNNIKSCLASVSSGGKQMGATTSIDYIYRLQGSRNTKKYKISNKNGENEGTIKTTKNSIAPARIVV